MLPTRSSPTLLAALAVALGPVCIEAAAYAAAGAGPAVGAAGGAWAGAAELAEGKVADREMGVEMEGPGWGPGPIDPKAAPEEEELTDDERGPIVGCDDGCDVQQIHTWETRWVESGQER